MSQTNFFAFFLFSEFAISTIYDGLESGNILTQYEVPHNFICSFKEGVEFVKLWFHNFKTNVEVLPIQRRHNVEIC